MSGNSGGPEQYNMVMSRLEVPVLAKLVEMSGQQHLHSRTGPCFLHERLHAPQQQLASSNVSNSRWCTVINASLLLLCTEATAGESPVRAMLARVQETLRFAHTCIVRT